MPYLVAAVVLLALITAVNLLLTLGVIRRLREQSSPPHGGHAASDPPAHGLRPGVRPESFTATTTDGERISDSDVHGMVGFFSAHCTPCHTLAPRFAEQAEVMGRDRVIAVIAGTDPELSAVLAPVARVIVEDYDGAVQAAFHNSWTPWVYLLGRDRRVVASGGRMTDLFSEAPA
ncbi:peroxiredoxin family protein [Embleya hyalina]|uniref:TlpA family protein n=1 Tax=Embleya hyalina TaxID=516124 RepID=A0A401YJH2_9ACTN|nr:TlpA family protein disulfide reductase [Embleya hyalina]GCD94755.1 TlpA family protein [Embleya hyalina]